MDYVKNKAHSIYRNPLIAEILYKSQDIDSYASGIKRMYDECNTNGVKLDFREEKIGFTIIFYRKNFKKTKEVKENVEVNVGVNVGVNKTQKRILEIIFENNNITQEELACELNVSIRTIERNVSTLRKKGFLDRVGSDKNGYWEIVK